MIATPNREAKKNQTRIYKYAIWQLIAKYNEKNNLPLQALPVVQKLAQLCGVNQATVYRWLNIQAGSKNSIPPDDANIIAAFFQVKGVELFSEYYRVNYLNIKTL